MIDVIPIVRLETIQCSGFFADDQGRILNICASGNLGSCDGNLVNLSYKWNTIGNLDWRSDAFANNTNPERFCYDGDSRVTAYSFNGSTCTAAGGYAVGYDALGNITTKTDITDATCATTSGNCYLYGTNGVGVHAVQSIDLLRGRDQRCDGEDRELLLRCERQPRLRHHESAVRCVCGAQR